MERRAFLLSSVMATLLAGIAKASPIDPKQTFVLQHDDIEFVPWRGLPPNSGEMAKLYGDFDQMGPYLVLMKWNPGSFSAPHSYATDRVQMVLSGTWWVNRGADFTPKMAVPVSAGGFVKRTARTFHYDGVPGGIKEPVVVAVFGIGPVDIELADPKSPSWRRVSELNDSPK
ncbi:MAG TPA: hypothetical protein VNO32_31405 [Candidatus Acidoferrum sp.]|nr:hypothetical protein [Candidatus Acidoferrum sp.]